MQPNPDSASGTHSQVILCCWYGLTLSSEVPKGDGAKASTLQTPRALFDGITLQAGSRSSAFVCGGPAVRLAGLHSGSVEMNQADKFSGDGNAQKAQGGP